MLAKVIIENGVKKIQALTADTGTGAPVGSYLYLEKKSNPQGYLYCDGSTFDETVYPALYQYLGTNVLPDWRELGAKGAEKNTTLIFDSTETDPSTGQAGTQNHDVFTQGEFKDDQLQEHKHYVGNRYQGSYTASGSVTYEDVSAMGTEGGDIKTGRVGTVTRGKSRAVFIYIKATSGLTENQQENVLNTINENNSYSTEEHPTGKKWIDGKDIYSLVIINISFTTGTRLTYNLGNNISTAWIDFTHSYVYGGFGIRQPWSESDFYVDNGVINFETQHPSGYLCAVVEYTKTTDN